MGTGDDPERQPSGSSRRLSSPAQLELAEHGSRVAGSFRRRRSTQARAGWRSSPRSEGLLSARRGARCLHVSPRSDLESCMSGSLITGRSREAERDRCRSSTSPPDQSAGTRPQGPARRPSGRSFQRGIEGGTVRGLVNGAQPSDPSGGYRRASNAAKRAQRLQSGRSVANMATDPARASFRSSGRRRRAPRMTHSASKRSRT